MKIGIRKGLKPLLSQKRQRSRTESEHNYYIIIINFISNLEMSHLSKNSENYYEYKHFSQCTIHKPDRNSVKTLCSVIRTKIKHSLWKYKQHQRRDCTEFSKLIDQNIHRKTKNKPAAVKGEGNLFCTFYTPNETR